MMCLAPEPPLEADLGVTEEVCFPAVGTVGLSLAGEGAQLQGSGNLKVGETERRLEWYRGEPDPAELGRCLDHGLGLFWGQRAKQCLHVPGKDLLAAIIHWIAELVNCDVVDGSRLGLDG
jgi:hypothetical protein